MLPLSGVWSRAKKGTGLSLPIGHGFSFLASVLGFLKLKGLPVRVQEEKAMAVAYIDHQGGKRSRAAQE